VKKGQTSKRQTEGASVFFAGGTNLTRRNEKSSTSGKDKNLPNYSKEKKNYHQGKGRFLGVPHKKVEGTAGPGGHGSASKGGRGGRSE